MRLTLKILVASPTFMPAYAFGGAPKIAYDIGKELAKRNHEVVVYTTDAKDLSSRLSKDVPSELDGMNVRYLRNISMRLVRSTNLFLSPLLLSEVIRNLRDFDIVHLNELRTFQNAVIHHYAKMWNIPYVVQVHGQIPFMEKRQKMKKAYD